MSKAGEEIDDDLIDIETYETEDGTVLYDSKNPLAWIKADNTITLKESL